MPYRIFPRPDGQTVGLMAPLPTERAVEEIGITLAPLMTLAGSLTGYSRIGITLFRENGHQRTIAASDFPLAELTAEEQLIDPDAPAAIVVEDMAASTLASKSTWLDAGIGFVAAEPIYAMTAKDAKDAKGGVSKTAAANGHGASHAVANGHGTSHVAANGHDISPDAADGHDSGHESGDDAADDYAAFKCCAKSLGLVHDGNGVAGGNGAARSAAPGGTAPADLAVIGVLYLIADTPHRADPALAGHLTMLAANASAIIRGGQAAYQLSTSETKFREEQHRRELLGRQVERLSQIGVWSLDVKTGHLSWSDKVFEIYGLPIGETPPVEQALLAYSQEDRERIMAALERTKTHGEAYSFEAKITAADGVERRVMSAGDAHFSDGEVVSITGVIQDVTLHREREATLEWVLEIVSHAREAFVVYDMDEKVVFWNRQAGRTFGWSRDEAIGRDIVDLLQIDPDLHAMRHDMMMRHGSWSGKAIYKNRSGLNVTVLAHKTFIKGKGNMQDGFIVVYQDISEKMVLSEKMQSATRLDAIGQLTGGIAHDFNNLLTVIMGSADIMKMRARGNDKLLELIDMNRGAAERGRDLVNQLLAFARRQTLDPTATDVATLIEDARPLIQRALGEQYSLTIEMEPDLWFAEVDPTKLDSALMNLCINARDACEPGRGRIAVSVRNVVIDDDYVSAQADGLEGDFVLLSVSDNGCGMSPDVMRRAIEPFFTTKEEGERTGTGLGLSMAYGFVKQLGGSLQIYSEEGAGTTVRLYLPRASKGETAAKASPEELSPSMPLRILVVEDDPRVRDNTVVMLEALGHHPVTVSSGPQALLHLEIHRKDIDLMFTDVILPEGMSGFDLARVVHARWPDLRVLFCSGYTRGALEGEEARLARGKMLSKPYSLAELSHGLAIMGAH